MAIWSRKKQSEDSFAALRGFTSGLDTALFLVKKGEVIVFANERAKAMFNFQEMEGRTVLAMTLSHNIERLVRQTFETSLPQADELTIRTSDDLTVIARCWIDPSDDKQAFLTLRDVTDMRKLERVRQDFVANVSHEIKTPLTTIRAMTEVIAEVETEDEVLRAKYLRQILGEVDRLSLIVDDLLTLSTAERHTLNKEPCDLSEIVEDVVIQLRPKALLKDLELDFEAQASAPLYANATQITQIALNLIDNAINYTTDGSVAVRISVNEGYATLSVTDSGIGIPSEDLPRIFERFYRVDKSRSRASGGTGLGLSIVKHMVESHDGSVSVESTLNRGSTFTVQLPLDSPHL